MPSSQCCRVQGIHDDVGLALGARIGENRRQGDLSSPFPRFGPGYFETMHRGWTERRLIGRQLCSKTSIIFTGELGSRMLS